MTQERTHRGGVSQSCGQEPALPGAKAQKFHIVLSSYNGGTYIWPQIDSILAQRSVELKLTVRDDGSRDQTPDLINDVFGDDSRVSCVRGQNLGVAKSFFEALTLSDANSGYFAFSDQDDVWLPDKLSRAAACLSQLDSARPAMYCSRVRYVDQDLNALGLSSIPTEISFRNALIENVAIGCTVVLNRAARDLICSRIPEFASMHDAWCYLVVSAFGEVVYDPMPTVLYRQHGANVVGGQASLWRRLLRRLGPFLRSLRTGKRRASAQVEEFMRLFGDDLSPGDRALAEEFLAARTSLWRRIRFVASGSYRRNDRREAWVYVPLFILGIY